MEDVNQLRIAYFQLISTKEIKQIQQIKNVISKVNGDLSIEAKEEDEEEEDRSQRKDTIKRHT